MSTVCVGDRCTFINPNMNVLACYAIPVAFATELLNEGYISSDQLTFVQQTYSYEEHAKAVYLQLKQVLNKAIDGKKEVIELQCNSKLGINQFGMPVTLGTSWYGCRPNGQSSSWSERMQISVDGKSVCQLLNDDLSKMGYCVYDVSDCWDGETCGRIKLLIMKKTDPRVSSMKSCFWNRINPK